MLERSRLDRASACRQPAHSAWNRQLTCHCCAGHALPAVVGVGSAEGHPACSHSADRRLPTHLAHQASVWQRSTRHAVRTTAAATCVLRGCLEHAVTCTAWVSAFQFCQEGMTGHAQNALLPLCMQPCGSALMAVMCSGLCPAQCHCACWHQAVG